DGTGVYHDAAITLTKGADLLVHDSQHTAAELPRLGFLGHSAVEYAVALAQRAGARQLEDGLLTFEPVLEAALVVGALTVDAARGSDGPFDPRIHALRGQPGQIDVARYYRALLEGSAIRASHRQGGDRVQDLHIFRFHPQVVCAPLPHP